MSKSGKSIGLVHRLMRLAITILALAVCASILLVANLRFVTANPGGNDFLARWVGTRALLVERESPYRDSVARQTQMLAYGRAALPGEDEMRFAYPLYSAILFAPFALIRDYALARAVWTTVLELALAGLALIAVRLARWQQSLTLAAVYLLFAVTWYHGVRPLVNGNPVVIVALLVGLGLAAMRAGRDTAAGVLLALATIKPQVVILVVLFVGVWVIARRRWRLATGFLVALGALVGASLIILPTWPVEFLGEVIRYPAYNPPGTLGAALEAMLPGIGANMGRVVTLALSLLLAFEWVRSLRASHAEFEWTVNLTLAATCWIGVQTDPGNFVVLILPLAAILGALAARHPRWGERAALAVMLFVHIGLWLLFVFTLERGDQPVQGPIMFLPLPLLVLFGLYALRRQIVESGSTSIQA